MSFLGATAVLSTANFWKKMIRVETRWYSNLLHYGHSWNSKRITFLFICVFVDARNPAGFRVSMYTNTILFYLTSLCTSTEIFCFILL